MLSGVTVAGWPSREPGPTLLPSCRRIVSPSAQNEGEDFSYWHRAKVETRHVFCSQDVDRFVAGTKSESCGAFIPIYRPILLTDVALLARRKRQRHHSSRS